MSNIDEPICPHEAEPVPQLKNYVFDPNSNTANILELGNEICINFNNYNIPPHIAERLCLFIDMGAFYESKHFVRFLDSVAAYSTLEFNGTFKEWVNMVDDLAFAKNRGIQYRLKVGILTYVFFNVDEYNLLDMMSAEKVEDSKHFINEYILLRQRIYFLARKIYSQPSSNQANLTDGGHYTHQMHSHFAQINDECKSILTRFSSEIPPSISNQISISNRTNDILHQLLNEVNEGIKNLNNIYAARQIPVSKEPLARVPLPNNSCGRTARGASVHMDINLVTIGNVAIPFYVFGVCPHFHTPKAYPES